MDIRMVMSIVPDKKDFDRAKNLLKGDSYSRIGTEASKMSKLIQDIDKLVRRSKAVASVWSISFGGRYFLSAFGPFEEALRRKGFDTSMVDVIINYRNDKVGGVGGVGLDRGNGRKKINVRGLDDVDFSDMKF